MAFPNIYQPLVDGYFQVMAAFPPAVAWVVSLLILIGLVFGLLALVRANLLFLILLILLLPAIIPILLRLLTDLYMFILFVLHQTAAQAPKGK